METEYEVVGRLSKEQAVAVAEELACGSVLWDRGRTFPCEGVEVRVADGASELTHLRAVEAAARDVVEEAVEQAAMMRVEPSPRMEALRAVLEK